MIRQLVLVLGIASYWRKRTVRLWRSELRGARHLNSLNNFQEVNRLKTVALKAIARDASNRKNLNFTGHGHEADAKSLVQYVWVRISSVFLPGLLLRAHDPRQRSQVFAPLPSSVAHALHVEGLDVCLWKCRLLWAGYCTATCLFGFGTLLKLSLSARESDFGGMSGTTYLYGLSRSSFPSASGAKRYANVYSWIKSNPELVSGVGISHSVSELRGTDIEGLTYNSSPFPSISRLTTGIFFSRGCAVIGFSLIQLAIGRWPQALFAHEIIQRERMRYSNFTDLPSMFLFSLSNLKYRPLWTYLAEDSGSRVALFFYSANSLSASQQIGNKKIIPEYEYITWENLYVCDERQAQFLRDNIDISPNISVVGVIPLSDDGIELNLPEVRKIAYFDVQPQRDQSNFRAGKVLDFYKPDVVLKSLKTLLKAAEDFGAFVAYKKKREIGKLSHPQFRAGLRGFMKNPRLLTIPPERAAQRVIEQSEVVVSMPWTSTALLARQLGKPSCYLDLSGMLSPSDPGAHDIPLLQSESELRNWLKLNLPSPSPLPESYVKAANASGRSFAEDADS